MIKFIFVCLVLVVWSPLDVRSETNEERWKKMSPEQQAKLRENFEKFKQLEPEKKEKLKANWERFNKFDPEQKKKIREGYRRWKELSPEQKSRLSLDSRSSSRCLQRREQRSLSACTRLNRDEPTQEGRDDHFIFLPLSQCG